MAGIITFEGWYSPELCQRYRKRAFVFGDNLRRFGMGGQAIIRNEINTIGVATKRQPTMIERAFFSEGSPADMDAVLDDIEKVWDALKNDWIVVIPVTKAGEVSLGLERAELKVRAPSIYETIVSHVREMQSAYGHEHAATEEEFANIR